MATPFPEDSHLLVIFPTPEPTDLTQELARRTNLRITWLNALSSVPDQSIFQDVDILATLLALPQSRDVCPKLKYIHLIVAGTDAVAKSPLFRDPSIRWTTSSGIHAVPMAEWVFMTYLAFSRHYDHWRGEQVLRRWEAGSPTHSLGLKDRDMYGQRMGIMGYGSIGRQIARVGRAFGMEILAFTASPKETPASRRKTGYSLPGTGDPDGTIPAEWYSGLDRESVHQFLSQRLDILVLCVPLTDHTRGLIGKTEFDLLAKHSPSGSAFLCNISRGPVVVQNDLIDALNAKGSGIRGAALDVADPEPLPPDNPLWKAPNCFISPHVSAHNTQFAARGLEILVRNLERRWDERFVNEVDTKRGY